MSKTEREDKTHDRVEQQPQYAVMLWNDELHTHRYVVRMMCELFGHTKEWADELIDRLNTNGGIVCCVTHLEHAELKRDQIHSMGCDLDIKECVGPMDVTLQPV